MEVQSNFSYFSNIENNANVVTPTPVSTSGAAPTLTQEQLAEIELQAGAITSGLQSWSNWLLCTALPAIPIASWATKYSKNLSEAEVNTVIEASNKAVAESKLSTTSVKIKNAVEVEDNLKKAFKKKWFVRFLPEKIKEKYATRKFNQYANGNNAAFFYGDKLVVVSPKSALSRFHELGHAINTNFSSISRATQRLRAHSGKLAFAFFLFALFTDKRKSKEGKELNFGEKSINFIQENVGKIGFLCFAPRLYEELTASINGSKLAKSVLEPAMYKNVLKLNALAYCTYLLGAIGACGGAWAGIKAKDAIIKNGLIKEPQKQNQT